MTFRFHNRDATRSAAHRQGLTLVEILVASALMVTLMMGLWNLVGMYTALRDKSLTRSSHLRAVATFLGQLERDLRGIPLPGGATSRPHAPKRQVVQSLARVTSTPTLDVTDSHSIRTKPSVFYGTSTSIEFWVIAGPSPESIQELVDIQDHSSGGESKSVQFRQRRVLGSRSVSQGERPSIDLRRVRYRLLTDDADLSGDGTVVVREEERSPPSSSMDSPETRMSLRKAPPNELQTGSTFGSIDGPSEDISIREQSFADIQTVRFSYFDGEQWRRHWNSRNEGLLPVAIQIQMWFRGVSALSPKEPVEESIVDDAVAAISADTVSSRSLTPERADASLLGAADADQQRPLAGRDMLTRQPERSHDLTRLFIVRLPDPPAAGASP